MSFTILKFSKIPLGKNAKQSSFKQRLKKDLQALNGVFN